MILAIFCSNQYWRIIGLLLKDRCIFAKHCYSWRGSQSCLMGIGSNFEYRTDPTTLVIMCIPTINFWVQWCWAVVSKVAFKNFTWVVLIKVKRQPPKSLYKWFENWERFTQSEPIMLAFILVRGRIHLAYHRWQSKTSHWHQIRHTSSLSCFRNSSFWLFQQGFFGCLALYIHIHTYVRKLCIYI